MESTKLSSHAQPALKRAQNAYRIVYEGATPARVSIVQHLSTKEKGAVVVTHIYTETGNQSAVVNAYVYSDEKVAAAITNDKMLAKQQPKAAAESA